jgi:hypothetical protein
VARDGSGVRRRGARREAGPVRGAWARSTRRFRLGGSVQIFLIMVRSDMIRRPSENARMAGQTVESVGMETLDLQNKLSSIWISVARFIISQAVISVDGSWSGKGPPFVFVAPSLSAEMYPRAKLFNWQLVHATNQFPDMI